MRNRSGVFQPSHVLFRVFYARKDHWFATLVRAFMAIPDEAWDRQNSQSVHKEVVLRIVVRKVNVVSWKGRRLCINSHAQRMMQQRRNSRIARSSNHAYDVILYASYSWSQDSGLYLLGDAFSLNLTCSVPVGKVLIKRYIVIKQDFTWSRRLHSSKLFLGEEKWRVEILTAIVSWGIVSEALSDW